MTGDVELHTTSAPWTGGDEGIQGWIAVYGEARGLGTTKAGALRDLASNLDRRDVLAATGEI